MPRKYIRKTNRGTWSAENLKAALKAIENGRSQREVAKAFNIPRATLQDHIKCGSPSKIPLGRKPIFTTAEEKELTDQVIKLGKLFYGITPLEIQRCAYTYAVKNKLKHPFSPTHEKAGRDWLEGFLRRNSTISLRKPESTSANRIEAFNKEEVTLFYDNLNKLNDKYKFLPSRIFNADETGISTVQRPNKIYAEKGQKRVGFVTSAERGKTTTVLCAFSAAGAYVPPLFIFARKRMAPHLTKNGPPGAVYMCSDNGWITEEIFVKWLKHFQNFVKATLDDPVLLAIDNHSTHCTLETYNYCKENGILILTIPPHTSHRIQPLDVSFYGPLKKAYNNECDKFLRTHVGERISTSEIAELFNKAFGRVATPEKATKGFEATGICPINGDIFTEDDFLPANFIKTSKESTNVIENQNALGENTIVLTPRSPLTVISQNIQDTTPEKKTSFGDILNYPSTSKAVLSVEKQKKGRTKQHSEIFTATPMKSLLEEKKKENNEE